MIQAPTLPELFKYGIREENSDARAHVCPLTGCVYAYQTKFGIEAINTGNYRLVDAYHPDVKDGPTSRGYLVPPDDIRDIRRLNFASYQHWDKFKTLNSSQKGKLAVEVVIELLEKGRFPIWVKLAETENTTLNIKGTDLLYWGKYKIQVKCDGRGGHVGKDGKGGSGYLFLQDCERNPLGLH